jgi:Zn finger protein HypA/HybF involved in hydrogenase expression
VKRASRSPQYVTCQDCGKRIMVALAKKGICPACHVAEQGLIIDIRISEKSKGKERGRSPRGAQTS